MAGEHLHQGQPERQGLVQGQEGRYVRAPLQDVWITANEPTSPECMGAVCAIVYLLTIIVFIPFPFYKDIVAATSGGGNRDFVVEVQHVETGRLLHKFPHNKVGQSILTIYFRADLWSSWRPTSLRSCPFRLSSFWASQMTCSTYDGGTKSSFQHSP